VRVTVLKEIPEDPDLSEAWNALVLAMENPEVFFTYQWALAASRGFQTRLSPLLFLMYDSDQLAGVVALAIDPNAPRAAFFLTSSTADYCDIVSTPANRKKSRVSALVTWFWPTSPRIQPPSKNFPALPDRATFTSHRALPAIAASSSWVAKRNAKHFSERWQPAARRDAR
jgi:hypothetical protein